MTTLRRDKDVSDRVSLHEEGRRGCRENAQTETKPKGKEEGWVGPPRADGDDVKSR